MTTNEKIEQKKKVLLKIFSKYKYADLSKGQHDKLNKLARHILAAEIEVRLEERKETLNALIEIYNSYRFDNENNKLIVNVFDCLKEISDKFINDVRIKELEQQLKELKND